jgi:hypothetical protein
VAVNVEADVTVTVTVDAAPAAQARRWTGFARFGERASPEGGGRASPEGGGRASPDSVDAPSARFAAGAHRFAPQARAPNPA